MFVAIVASAMSAGQTSSFAPDYRKAKAAAAKIFALLDTTSTIDSSDQYSTELVTLFIHNHRRQFIILTLTWKFVTMHVCYNHMYVANTTCIMYFMSYHMYTPIFSYIHNKIQHL